MPKNRLDEALERIGGARVEANDKRDYARERERMLESYRRGAKLIEADVQRTLSVSFPAAITRAMNWSLNGGIFNSDPVNLLNGLKDEFEDEYKPAMTEAGMDQRAIDAFANAIDRAIELCKRNEEVYSGKAFQQYEDNKFALLLDRNNETAYKGLSGKIADALNAHKEALDGFARAFNAAKIEPKLRSVGARR